MAIAEVLKPKGHLPPPLISSESTPRKIEDSGIYYDPAEAKKLATLYLTNQICANGLNLEINSADAYTLGLIEIQEQILRMIGQGHLLVLDGASLDVNNPPMHEVKPVSLGEIEVLARSYQATRSFLKDVGFDSKPESKITPSEARIRGQMVELAKSLFQFGQGEVVRKIDEKYEPPRRFLDTSRHLH